MGRLTLPQLDAYLDTIPLLEQRRHAAVATLTYVVASVVGNEVEPDAFMPSFARMPDEITGPRYDQGEALELRWALKKNLISQDMLDLIDWNAVKVALPVGV